MNWSFNALAVEQIVIDNLSGKISEKVAGWIPGEGHTEASIELRDEGNPDFEILAVRDILAQTNSNYFTQFSLHNGEVDSNNRLIGNIGLGYRFLTDDKSTMLGVNSFLDADFGEGHRRGSIGLEAKKSILDFTFNEYFKISNQKFPDSVKEQVLSGREYNLSSQVPHMPWATINLQGYYWENELATRDTKGNVYSLEMMLSPSLQLDYNYDESSNDSIDDEQWVKLSFLYPPKETKPTLADGFISEEQFVKENMEEKLKEKVRRNNDLVVEVQGSVIITSK
tara:strand:- start:465 stop:1310 length:846 start_codon:yes stop_codon:yes gene_type:complete